MFDFSFGELAIIAVVALVVLGPERLPKVARTAGHLLGRARAYANQVKSDIDREVQMDELRKLQQQAQDAARSFETAVNDVGRNVESETAKIGNEMASDSPLSAEPQPTPSPGSSAVADEIAALETSIAEQAQSQGALAAPGAQDSSTIGGAARNAANDIR